MFPIISKIPSFGILRGKIEGKIKACLNMNCKKEDIPNKIKKILKLFFNSFKKLIF